VADFLEKAPASETAPYILEGMSVKPPDAGGLRLGLVGAAWDQYGHRDPRDQAWQAPLDRRRMLQ
jgi:hypothetical protein